MIAGVSLLAHDDPRRLVYRLSGRRHDQVIAASRAERELAEQQLRQTAEQLAAALLREAEAQGLRAAATVAQREAGHVLSQLADALLAPGKAGLSILDRLTRNDDTIQEQARHSPRRCCRAAGPWRRRAKEPAATLARMGTGLASPSHLLILLLVVLLVFGPKKLPEIGRSLGRGIRDFKTHLSDEQPEIADAEVTPVRALPPSSQRERDSI